MDSDAGRGPGAWGRHQTRIVVAATVAAVIVIAAITVAFRFSQSTPAKAGYGPPTGPYTLAAPVGWTATVNGKKPSTQDASGLPQFDVRPGQQLTIAVTITVPGRVAMTQLFLGITGDSSGVGPRGPIGMEPVLKTAQNVPPGPHQFTLHWTLPAGSAAGAGHELALAQFWPKTAKEPQASEAPEDAIALSS